VLTGLLEKRSSLKKEGKKETGMVTYTPCLLLVGTQMLSSSSDSNTQSHKHQQSKERGNKSLRKHLFKRPTQTEKREKGKLKR
jgi:hypothetical protein